MSGPGTSIAFQDSAENEIEPKPIDTAEISASNSDESDESDEETTEEVKEEKTESSKAEKAKTNSKQEEKKGDEK